MAKRPKWLDRTKSIPSEIGDEFASEPTGLENMRYIDRAFWIDLKTDGSWINALYAIDNEGNKEPLLELLKSDRSLSQEIRNYLADLLSRYQLKKKRGRQATPAYDRTDAEAILEMAIEDVRHLVKGSIAKAQKPMRVADALGQVSKEQQIPLEILASTYAGRRGATRRMKKRRR